MLPAPSRAGVLSRSVRPTRRRLVPSSSSIISRSAAGKSRVNLRRLPMDQARPAAIGEIVGGRDGATIGAIVAVAAVAAVVAWKESG